MAPALDGPAQSYASAYSSRHCHILSVTTISGLVAEVVNRDRVRDPVECTDRDSDLVMHRGKDMDMFQLERDFNVPDVALAYIDGKRQMVCSLLRRYRRSPARRGGAQLVAEEPSPTERSGRETTGKESSGGPATGDGREQRSAAVGQGGCVARRRSDDGQGGCAAARKWRMASAEVGSGGDRTSGSVAVQRELMAGDVDAGEGLDGRQRRGSSDAGSGVARQRGRRGGSDERVGSAAKARECGAGERPAAAPARQRQRRGERRGGALSSGRMRDFDEIATTRWRDLGVGCRVRKSRRERDVLRFAISRVIVEIVVDRVGPLASESWLLFICDMSSYPDAVDISQLSVRWGL
ncbi:hypothetical protein Scep_020147 [Stephania cephalantha]|uniref:Uncharacterized protein n=1 Tax=Stephania cephalantha TaxID=152367 RepID=A0AAP0NMW6_9MAGN